ncbi:MAG: glycosyltransferase family 4 protein [Deltaproteobacteria bacterium]|nr:glycosyltransferase family 4 protein [Deltaproteobacteria bacterium]
MDCNESAKPRVFLRRPPGHFGLAGRRRLPGKFYSDSVELLEEPTARKVLLVANTGWYLYNFRRPLARALRERGLAPAFVSPRDAYVDRLIEEGFRWIELPMDRAGVNPAAELLTLSRLTAVYRRERPVAVHHMTIKCVLYGTLAAFATGTGAVVNAVTGLGHVFISNGWKARLVRPLVVFLYRRALTARRVRVVFQNGDDLAVFRDLGLVAPERVALIRGSGIDTARFAPPPPGGDATANPPLVLVVARLLEEKGIREFVEAAKLLRARGVSARFEIAGDRDPGNPSSIEASKIDAWRAEGSVRFLGHVDGVEKLLAQATLVVLPSYREGVPRTLLEAAAMARPIVATDVPGCREVVVHGTNGLLVPARDAAALADAIEALLKNPVERARMGAEGRRKACGEFDEKSVIAATLALYEALGVFG